MTTPLTLLATPGLLQLGGLLAPPNVQAGAYTFDASPVAPALYDTIVLCNFSSAHAVTLPAHKAGRILVVADIAGNAATNNITITPASGNINGAGTYVLNLNKSAVALVDDGTNYWVFASYNGTVI